MFLHIEAGINEVQIIFVSLPTLAMFGDGYALDARLCVGGGGDHNEKTVECLSE